MMKQQQQLRHTSRLCGGTLIVLGVVLMTIQYWRNTVPNDTSKMTNLEYLFSSFLVFVFLVGLIVLGVCLNQYWTLWQKKRKTDALFWQQLEEKNKSYKGADL